MTEIWMETWLHAGTSLMAVGTGCFMSQGIGNAAGCNGGLSTELIAHSFNLVKYLLTVRGGSLGLFIGNKFEDLTLIVVTATGATWQKRSFRDRL
jgi:hypothetical protein